MDFAAGLGSGIPTVLIDDVPVVSYCGRSQRPNRDCVMFLSRSREWTKEDFVVRARGKGMDALEKRTDYKVRGKETELTPSSWLSSQHSTSNMTHDDDEHVLWLKIDRTEEYTQL